MILNHFWTNPGQANFGSLVTLCHSTLIVAGQSSKTLIASDIQTTVAKKDFSYGLPFVSFSIVCRYVIICDDMWSFTKLYIAIVAFSILFHVCGYLVNYDQFTEPWCRGVKHKRPLKGTSLQSKWSSFSFRRRRNESADVRHLREQAFWKRRGNGRYSQFWWCPALNVPLMGIVMALVGIH